jgi:uncharacterized protein (TIGR02145 family)
MKKHLFLAIGISSLLFFSCKKDEETKTDDNNNNNSANTITDSRDGKVYKTVSISGQTWFAENLRYTGGTHYCYNGEDDSCASTTSGVFYDSLAATTACPSGWHLPSDAEFRLLEHNIGMSDADTALTGNRGDGTALKSGGSTGFNVSVYPGQINGTNSNSAGDQVNYWLTKGYSRQLRVSTSTINRYQYTYSVRKFCIRCIKD